MRSEKPLGTKEAGLQETNASFKREILFTQKRKYPDAGGNT
jgi:hypothetical protein